MYGKLLLQLLVPQRNRSSLPKKTSFGSCNLPTPSARSRSGADCFADDFAHLSIVPLIHSAKAQFQLLDILAMPARDENDGGSLGELVSLKVSPWSLRARWALTHHRCHYSETYYTPFISAPRMWYRLSFPRDKITVPVFFPIEGSPPLRDSLEIAQMADKKQSLNSDSIFPPNAGSEIESWVQCIEPALAYGRERYARNVMMSEEATLSFIPKSIRWVHNFGGVSLIRWLFGTTFISKYPVSADAEAEAHRSWSAVLQRLHKVKSNSSNKQSIYLVGGRFTFADIAVSSATIMIEPLKRKFFRGTNTHDECVRNEEFREKFDEVIQWRDDIFERHFPESLWPIPRQQ